MIVVFLKAFTRTKNVVLALWRELFLTRLANDFLYSEHVRDRSV